MRITDTPTNKQDQNHGVFLVNGVSFKNPNVPVLLQILNGVPASDLLPSGSIYTVGGGQSVEVTIPGGAGGSGTGGPVRCDLRHPPRLLIDARIQHPIHLHGHNFYVVRSAGNSTYNFDNPVIRDVVSAGNTNDSVTIRFMTDNPGPWFLHCHIDWHLAK
jgi:iron transport multicopper oxidase